MQQPLSGLRIAIVVEDKSRFEVVRALCLDARDGARAVHWLAHYEAARDALVRGTYDVAILDSGHHGVALLREMARSRLNTPAVVLVENESISGRDGVGVTCAFVARNTTDSGRLQQAIREVVDRAAVRANPRSQSRWRCGGLTVSHATDFPMPTPTHGSFFVDATPRDLHEDLVAGVLRHLPVIVGRLDAAGCMRDVAGASLAHHGLDPRQLHGARFLALFPEGQNALERARAGEAARFEACLNAGTVGAWRVQFDLFHDSDGGAGPMFVGQDVTPRRTLEGQILLAVEAERHRLGADLHDEVGQLLTGISCLGTALVARLRGRDDLAAEDATTIADAAKDALAQIRSLAHGLAPVHLARRGLSGALEELRTQTLRMHHVEVRLHLLGTRVDLDVETTAQLFRIAQEAITNAIRHGKATSIDVSLGRVGRQHRLAIADNGRGFDPKVTHHAAGSGLELMAYRAALIRGGFAVSSDPMNGTRIEISFVPLVTCAHENAC